VVVCGHLLHPELTADVSGVAHTHSLQVGDVDLDEFAECQLLKTRSSPIIAVLCWVSSKSPSFFNLDDSYYDTTGITYNIYNSDNRQ